jgi:serine/threonine protein kinase/Tfp pilus assembly protein PilF
MIGKTISHYKILEKLGEGGMGIVYKAHDTKLDRTVALKFLPPHLTKKDTDKARFLQEAKAAAALNHPNVCTIHEIHDEGENPFIVMEYVEGKTLRDLVGAIRESPLPMNDIIDYATQIAEALKTAHKKGIVHRDIKSENIMVTETGQVKVMDFGLAKLRGSVKITKTSTTVGTIAYMSPEHIEGKKVDARTDIFSFGVVLYELLTGQLPFKGEYDSAMMYAIINEEPEPVQKHRSDLSSEMLHVLNRALEKNPEERYQLMNEMLIDLKRLKRDESKSVDVKPVSAIPEKKKAPSFSWRYIIVAGSLFIFLLVTYFLYKELYRNRPTYAEMMDERSVTILYFENHSGDQNLDHWRKAITDLMIADISQSKFMKVSSSDKLVNILRDLDQLNVTSFSADVLVKIAERARTKHVVYGSFTKAGDVIRVNMTIKNPVNEELIGTEIVEGKGEESIFYLVDDLTSRIKTRFNFTADEIAGDIDKDVANITTSSAEAYKLYSMGRDLFNRHQYRESIKLMERAVNIDPEFALAYRSMAIANSNLSYRTERQRLLNKAIEFSDRLSDREKYLIQGDYYYRLDKRKAIEAYEQLLKRYPLDVTGNNNLGLLYNSIEEFEKALTCFENAMLGDPEIFTPYMNTAYAYTMMAEYEKARIILERYRDIYRDNGVIHNYFFEFHLYAGEYDEALKEAEITLQLEPDYSPWMQDIGDLYLLTGEWKKAEEVFKQLLDWEEVSARLRGRWSLYCLYLYQGKTGPMKEQAEQALRLARQSGMKAWEYGFLRSLTFIEEVKGNYAEVIRRHEEYLKEIREKGIEWGMQGVMIRLVENYSRIGDIKNAQRISEELKQYYANHLNTRLMRNYYYTQGLIQMALSAFPAAIDSFEQAIALSNKDPESGSHAGYFYNLAEAHRKNGDLDTAIEWYRKVIGLTRGRVGIGNIYAFSLYHVAKIHETKENIGKSIEYYDKFLELWKEADYNFPELADANVRLSKLKQGS